MAAQIPDCHAVERTVAILNSDQGLSDAQLREALEFPALSTGLDRWQLWTLLSLCRHLNRQKWVGYTVETRLKGDLGKLGTAGALGHPDGIPQEGEVPDEPGWRYYFHGRGCCLTHQEDGINLDVDFSDEGTSDEIDPFFYSRFLEDLKRPELPERMLQRKEPLQHAWQANIDALVLAGCLERKHRIRTTQFGRNLADSVEPIWTAMAEVARANSSLSHRRLVYGALSLGDLVLSQQEAERAEVGQTLATAIVHAADQARDRRASLLMESLRTTPPHDSDFQLGALADLGVKHARSVVTQCLFRTPVGYVANEALAILLHWNEPDLIKSLEGLIDLRYSQAFGLRSIARALVARGNNTERHPREYHIVHAILGLMQRSRPELLNPALRKKIMALLEASGGAHSGEAALLLYALSREHGLSRLRAALSGTVPAAHSDAAAACVLLGTPEAKQILIEALDNPNLQIQHTVACALKRFPSTDARGQAAKWSAKFDGIDSPLGEEVSIAGQTITTYPMDEVMHASKDMFFSISLDRLRKEFGLILGQAS